MPSRRRRAPQQGWQRDQAADDREQYQIHKVVHLGDDQAAHLVAAPLLFKDLLDLAVGAELDQLQGDVAQIAGGALVEALEDDLVRLALDLLSDLLEDFS